MPWIRRRRAWDSPDWTPYSQEEREKVYGMAARDLPHPAISIKPSPYVDVVVFNPSVYESYSALVEVIANLIVKAYNSIAIDPLVEFSVDAQTFSKGQGKARKTGKLNLPLRSNVPNQGLWRFLKLLRCLRLRWLLRLTQRIIEERNKLLELRIRREWRPSHMAHTCNRYRGSYALVDPELKLKTGKRAPCEQIGFNSCP